MCAFFRVSLSSATPPILPNEDAHSFRTHSRFFIYFISDSGSIFVSFMLVLFFAPQDCDPVHTAPYLHQAIHSLNKWVAEWPVKFGPILSTTATDPMTTHDSHVAALPHQSCPPPPVMHDVQSQHDRFVAI
jgi:hypothetical protein